MGISFGSIFFRNFFMEKEKIINFLTFYISLFKKFSISKCSFCVAWVKEKKSSFFFFYLSLTSSVCFSLFSDFPLYVFLLLTFLGFHTMAEWPRCFLSSIFFFSAFYMFRASTQEKTSVSCQQPHLMWSPIECELGHNGAIHSTIEAIKICQFKCFFEEYCENFVSGTLF